MKQPLPPGSVVRVLPNANGPYRHLADHDLRVGFYSKQDGLDCVWLVLPNGEYAETTDHRHLARYFHIQSVSDETDLFGENREPLGSIEAS